MEKIPSVLKYFLLALSCSFMIRAGAQQVPGEIIILHTNDMHARIDKLAKLAYLKDSLLQTNPLVFLVSAGDNFTGNPLVDMLQDKGYPMIDLMNLCGFDASVLGNHEFDMGQELLQKRIQQASFPFICCNINTGNAVLKQPPAFTILKKGDSIRLALLGIIQLGSNNIPESHPGGMTDLTFTNGIESAKDYLKLKDSIGNLIALSHLGLDDDLRLAETCPSFDLIIGGHSHSILDTPMIVKNVMIVQAGYHLNYIGKITLVMHNNHILSKKDELIPISALTKEKKEVRDLIDQYNDNKEMERVVGIAETAVVGKAELGSLMADAQTRELKLDVAFQNRGGIRSDSIAAGEIRLKDIYRLDPFGNQIVVFHMNAVEIKSLICQSYNMNKRLDLEVSGMTYTVLTDQDNLCIDVLMLDKQGMKLGNDRIYSVGLSNYVAKTYRFDHRDNGETLNITTAETLIKFLESGENINYRGVSRTSAVKNK